MGVPASASQTSPFTQNVPEPSNPAGRRLSQGSRSGLGSAPGNRSPGRPAEQLLDTSALALGRAARAAVAGSHRHSLLARRRGRAVVDIAPGGNRGADTLGDDLLDDHDALASLVAQPYLITGPYGMSGLDPHPVDPDVPGPAGTGRGRTGPGQPHRPEPAVYPPGLITCHPAHCNAIRARWLRPAGFVRESGDQMFGDFAARVGYLALINVIKFGGGRGVAEVEPLPGRGTSVELDGRRPAGEVAAAVKRSASGPSPGGNWAGNSGTRQAGCRPPGSVA
jgi:hypothetical protein